MRCSVAFQDAALWQQTSEYFVQVSRKSRTRPVGFATVGIPPGLRPPRRANRRESGPAATLGVTGPFYASLPREVEARADPTLVSVANLPTRKRPSTPLPPQRP